VCPNRVGTGTLSPRAAQKLLSDVIHIKCFDAASGRASDAYYTVYITKQYGDLAFAYASQPTSTNYAPPGSASYNPAGTMRVVRNGVGNYTVRFTGLGSRLTSNGGHAQAVALGTGAQHCTVEGWGGSPDLVIDVSCFSRLGGPKDVKFNVFFATPNPHLAYAWADQPFSPSLGEPGPPVRGRVSSWPRALKGGALAVAPRARRDCLPDPQPIRTCRSRSSPPARRPGSLPPATRQGPDPGRPRDN
jgi:hypothetical protein